MSSNDHRVLGQRLDLFSITEEVGQGITLWHPKGATVRRLLRDYWEKVHLENGYQLVDTPHIAKAELWDKSGHLHYYSDNMYTFVKDEQKYVVKPMNCPFHVMIYKSQPRSYRELPIRYGEWGTVYRYERSGTLHGLMRVRGFTQDDAHIFCTKKQLYDEIVKLQELTDVVLSTFCFTKSFELSTRDSGHPENYMGDEEDWIWAQDTLASVLNEKNLDYEELPGEAAFYGPKIDVKIYDSSGREWQCSTIQFDFNLAKRFDLEYTGADGLKHKPYMLHRVILGSIERFFGILLEHYNGNLQSWLAPTQVTVIPINEAHTEYAKTVSESLTTLGLRVNINDGKGSFRYRIRDAETQKVPYMAICGRREQDNETVSIRKHGVGDIGAMTCNALAELINNERPL